MVYMCICGVCTWMVYRWYINMCNVCRWCMCIVVDNMSYMVCVDSICTCLVCKCVGGINFYSIYLNMVCVLLYMFKWFIHMCGV